MDNELETYMHEATHAGETELNQDYNPGKAIAEIGKSSTDKIMKKTKIEQLEGRNNLYTRLPAHGDHRWIEIPADNSCALHAVLREMYRLHPDGKYSVGGEERKLPQTTQELRNQMVDYAEEENITFLFSNNPQTKNSITEVRKNEFWLGGGELQGVLSKMLGVNIDIYDMSGHDQIMQNAGQNVETINLLYVDGNHYELYSPKKLDDTDPFFFQNSKTKTKNFIEEK